MMTYEICVRSHLSPQRLRGFEGLTVNYQANGETRLVGSMPDQAAPYGLLIWLYDLGAALVSVRHLGNGQRRL